jgi:peptide/nickel transport system substrate-binding protein
VITAPGSGSAPVFPPLATDEVSRAMADNIYERLAEIGPALNSVGDRGFTPRLASSWDWANDSLSIAFHIDPRARWHDGRPVRAGDVRFTLDLLKDPKTATGYTSLIENIDSISVRDSLTAVAWFKKRTPEQFYDVAHQVYVLPEHILKDIPRENLGTSEVTARPVGSGRFRFARFEPGVSFEVVAETAHYRGRPKLDRVIVSYAADPGASVAQLLTGRADFLSTIPPDVLPQLDSAESVRPVPYDGLLYAFLGFNQRDPRRLSAPHPIFSDVRVRRALSLALDRQSMLRNVFDTVGKLGVGPFPRALADTGVKLIPFDTAHAAALLDSAGWRAGADGIRTKGGRPLAFTISVPTSSRPRMRYAVLIQEQLKKVGVNVTIDAMDFNAYQPRQNAGNFDAAMFSLSTDPSRSSAKQNWATAGLPPAGQNYLRYSSPRFDALLDTALASFDAARMDRFYRQAMQHLVDDAPAVWLYDVLTIAGAHKRIRPVAMRADGWWNGLSEWWIPPNERIDRDRIGLRPVAAQP